METIIRGEDNKKKIIEIESARISEDIICGLYRKNSTRGFMDLQEEYTNNKLER